jgi:hypothetical protein
VRIILTLRPKKLTKLYPLAAKLPLEGGTADVIVGWNRAVDSSAALSAIASPMGVELFRREMIQKAILYVGDAPNPRVASLDRAHFAGA